MAHDYQSRLTGDGETTTEEEIVCDVLQATLGPLLSAGVPVEILIQEVIRGIAVALCHAEGLSIDRNDKAQVNSTGYVALAMISAGQAEVARLKRERN